VSRDSRCSTDGGDDLVLEEGGELGGALGPTRGGKSASFRGEGEKKPVGAVGESRWDLLQGFSRSLLFLESLPRHARI
jgi:hypothetical protein